MATRYLVTTVPGLATVAAQEIRTWLDTESITVKPTRGADLCLFHAGAAPTAIAKLGTVEDVFVHLRTIELTGTRTDLRALKLPRLAGTKQGSTIRVVVMADDADWRSYRRIDLQTALEAAIQAANPQLKLARDQAQHEIWLFQSGRTALIGRRLTTAATRHRNYKTAHFPGSLKPTIAYALAWLSEPQTDDVVLDPFCGAGTILIERARLGRYRELIGSDISPEALAAARANFGPRHQPRRLEPWDARSLPLPDASVSAIITNPPWGERIGSRAANPALYRDFLAEAAQVLQPGGRLVLLTSETRLMQTLLADMPALKLSATVGPVTILGRAATIYVINKAA